MRLHDGKEYHIADMGIKLVGKRYVSIELSPEEIIQYNSEMDSDKTTMDYIRKLTRHYKKND